MATRLLVMFSVMLIELGCGIASILAVSSNYPYGLREEGVAGIVMIVVAIIVSWLLTIAFFVRKSSRLAAERLVDDAKREAGRILSEATERALALCSLDGAQCPACGNPRTGKFCPKCGATATSKAGAVDGAAAKADQVLQL